VRTVRLYGAVFGIRLRGRRRDVRRFRPGARARRRDTASRRWRAAVREGVGLEVELGNVKLSPEEIAAFTQREAACRDRVAHEPLATMATAYTMLSRRWLSEHPDGLRAVADPVLVEALDVVTHDWAFVSAKVHRALHGRDGDRHDEDRDDDPVQNDWNGSAKVALISLERSEAAWRVIVQATADEVAATLLEAVAKLRRLALNEFPRAMSFTRPGFDEPWR
jgi:hypothetical protein